MKVVFQNFELSHTFFFFLFFFNAIEVSLLVCFPFFFCFFCFLFFVGLFCCVCLEHAQSVSVTIFSLETVTLKIARSKPVANIVFPTPMLKADCLLRCVFGILIWSFFNACVWLVLQRANLVIFNSFSVVVLQYTSTRSVIFNSFSVVVLQYTSTRSVIFNSFSVVVLQYTSTRSVIFNSFSVVVLQYTSTRSVIFNSFSVVVPLYTSSRSVIFNSFSVVVLLLAVGPYLLL